MKSNRKTKTIILIILGVLFTVLPIFTINSNLKNSSFSDSINLDNTNLKSSKVSAPIHIDDANPSMNWSIAESMGICTGNGTYSEPYVIEDLVIDAGGSGSCIFINNSDVYFKIENCTFYNGDIRLESVSNGLLINNKVTSNNGGYGIYLYYSNNNMISENTANYNFKGIYLESSNNIEISGNILEYNDFSGIELYGSNNNTISGNTANNNDWGIYLDSSINNTISGNIASNDITTNQYYGIFLRNNCDDNTISGNTANYNVDDGIHLEYSDNNTVSENTANNNGDRGIFLYYSHNNLISGNSANNNEIGIRLSHGNNNTISGNTLIGNNECIIEEDCQGNVFENNDCEGRDEIIPGYNLFFLLGILSIVTIILNKKFKKS
ncbi:MAG: nitrous oxide reductase family maturation protein NosD [Promethearchaeota archaeon]